MMQRPLSEYRVLGPITEKLNFNQSNDSDIEYTIAYTGPAIPSKIDAPDDMVEQLVSEVERTLNIDLDLNPNQYEVFTESIILEELPKEGNMLVVKLKNVNMSENEAIELSKELQEDIENSVFDDLNRAVFEKDLFTSPESVMIDLETNL